MSVSRVRFLKSLGASLAGWATGSGIASAARALVQKNSAPSQSVAPAAPMVEEPPPVSFHETGPTEGNRIALTFDDGPTPGVTELILDELKKRNLSATFFMIGQRAVAARELTRRVFAEGHEIGNHTFHHLKLSTLPDPQAQWEIQKTQEALGEIINQQPAWLRPPYGALRQNQAHLATRKKLGVAMWSVDPRDWSQPGESKIVETISQQTKPGSIILCHDLHPQTAKCTGQILDELLSRDFKFVTISNFLSYPFSPLKM